MARGGKRGRKPKETHRSTGPSSADKVKAVKSIDEVLGIADLVMSEEEQKIEESSEQKEIDITEWQDLSGNVECDVTLGKKIVMPILKSNQKKGSNGTVSDKKEEPVRITDDDIEEEVAYWKPSIVGYVAGANPPLHVLEGFVKRIWKDEVDKVGMIAHGIFLIRFRNEESRDRAFNGGFIFFDKKPFIMQIWNSIDKFTQRKVDLVPTWIQLKGLDIKYWGQRSLFKIVEQIGKPIQMDEHTARRNKLMYPRLMVEVSMNQQFPRVISFVNELDETVILDVHYEWLPITCSICFGMGHEASVCRKKEQVTKVWKPKPKPQIDDDGFQMVVGKGKAVVLDKEEQIEHVNCVNQYSSLGENQESDNNRDDLNKGETGRVGIPSTSNG